MDFSSLKDLTALGLAAVALVVLGLVVRAVLVTRRAPEGSQGALKALLTKVDDLEGRINRKEEDLDAEFARIWSEIDKLRVFRHDQASNGTVLHMLTERVRALEARRT